MKNILIIGLCFFSLGLWAQPKGLPVNVYDSLMFKYPDATDLKSKKQKDDFRIRFENKGIKITSIYDAAGNWKESVSILKEENIPDNIKKSIKKKYTEGFISSVNLVEDNKGKIIYEATVDTEKYLINLELDNNGKILKTDQVRKETPSSNQGSGTDEE